MKTRRGQYTPCPGCDKPILWPANIEAWEIYALASSQIVTAGMGDAIAINFSALDFIFKIRPPEDPELTLQKIVAVYTIIFERSKEATTWSK